MIELSRDDYLGIGDIALACDYKKLAIAQQESILQDLEPLLCNLFVEVQNHWNDPTSPWVELIQGSTYINCAGYETTQVGLKKVFAYYSYARYVMLGKYNDTVGGGLVTKTSEWSIPTSLADIERISDHYRNMARDLYRKVMQFMYLNKDDYPGMCYEGYECKCDHCCNTTTRNKGYGVRSKTITK